MVEFWRSTIGKKTFVAVTGTILVGYLILHMVGNLNSLFGPTGAEPRVDWYAGWLRELGEPLLPFAGALWIVRAILLGSVIIHITGVVQLRFRNRDARPARYPARKIGRSWESGVMMTSGILLAAFIVFHILQFTTLTVDVTPLHHEQVYFNLYNAFQEWYFVAIYLVALILIGVHLRHGIWSLVQTLGLDSPARNRGIRYGATTLTLVIVVGFALVPILFWTGLLDAPEPPAATITAIAGGLTG
ncbi:MAG: succinate dehydrogenase cytochrome b subunit [Thermoleophilia bacterium]|nr:succinate dehydrogenase cytochrome b subunit [Thermoleophilia bacterium]